MTNITVRVGSKKGFKTNVFSSQTKTVRTNTSSTNNNVSVAIPGDKTVRVGTASRPSIFVNQSGFVERRIADLLDVDMQSATDGAVLIYSPQSKMFVASTVLDKQQINGGNF